MRILKYKKTDRARHKGQKKHAQNSERVKIHVSTGDTVKVVRGDDKGHVGKVMRVYRKTGRVVVEGANFVKRHRKARTADEQGGIISFEAPIHSSNVMLLDPKSEAPTRTRRRIDADGTKERLSAKSGEAIPRVR
ncbi:MAG: 50S ribosomal protein L24 [Thermoanaerobaculia bacterium]